MNEKFVASVLGLLLLIVVCLVMADNFASDARMERINNAKDSGYVWYLNGHVVDPDLLMLDKYFLEFDVENERVLVAPKY